MYEQQGHATYDLSLEELDAQELIELPERELMTGCSSGTSLLTVNASVCVNINASLNLGSGGGGGCN